MNNPESTSAWDAPAEPGWYSDPDNPEIARWWNGKAWTEQKGGSPEPVATKEVDQPEEITPETHPDEDWDRGWYSYAGGLRFWDNGWTQHYAPPTVHPPQPINYWKIAEAVAGGILVAWFIIWLGAQLSPDHVYLPVKFVVKELPEAFR
jgi:hypothetical protein